MSKICTSIKQSQKLIKLGIDVKTADMHWREWRRETKLISIPNTGEAGKNDLPAWSLSALMSQMPCVQLESSADNHYRVFWRYRSSNWFDDPIDACVELLETVKYEENEIKQEYGD